MAYVRSAVDLVRAARGYDRVVLVTGGVELFVLAALLPRRKTLVAADWLMPASTMLDRSRLLRRVRFVVIRRSDMATLADRFGVSDARFVPFPAPEPSGQTSEHEYVYSGAGLTATGRRCWRHSRRPGFPPLSRPAIDSSHRRT